MCLFPQKIHHIGSRESSTKKYFTTEKYTQTPTLKEVNKTTHRRQLKEVKRTAHRQLNQLNQIDNLKLVVYSFLIMLIIERLTQPAINEHTMYSLES